MLLEQLRAFKIPAVVFQAVAVVLLIKNQRTIKFVLQHFDIPLDRFGGAGKIAVLRDVGLAEFLGKRMTVRIAVFFQLRDKPDQSVELFFIERHLLDSSVVCVYYGISNMKKPELKPET